jgi:ubiquitin carboxyl-terminal hydrolase L3
MVPGPSKAVLLVFPITKDTEAKRKEEDEIIEKQGQPDVDPTLIYIKQTVRPYAP